MSLIGFISQYVLVLVVLAVVAWAAGTLAIATARRAGSWRPRSSRMARGAAAKAVEREAIPWPITFALGLAMLAHAAFLLAFAGWLTAPLVAVVALAIVGAAAVAGEWRRLWGDGPRRPIWRVPVAAMPILLVAVPPFILALYPPLGFDQTMYHLPFVRGMANSGGVAWMPALRFPVFPQIAEALQAAVLLWAGDVATQIVGWLALAACAGLAFEWTRERASSAAGGCLAAAMIVGSPLAIHLGATGYVDPIVGLFGAASIYAAERARSITRQSREHATVRDAEADLRWVVLAGVLAGSAAAVKYLGLYFVPAGALLLLSWRAPWRSTLRALVCYGAAALIVLAPTYARIFFLTGNPVFPFYPHVFGDSPWRFDDYQGVRGLAQLPGVATFLFDATFRRHLNGGLPFLGPAFLLGAPLAVWIAWRDRAMRRLLVVALGYMALAPLHAHYFLAVSPLWCVMTGVASARLVGSPADAAPSIAGRSIAGERLLLAAAFVIACGGDAYTAYRVRLLGLPPATSEAREQLLAAQFTAYRAIAFLNRTAGPVTVYGVGLEQMVDYTAGTLLGDWNGPARYTHVAARTRTLGSLGAALQEVGAAYLLVPEHRSDWIATADLDADPRLTRIYADRGATLYRVR